MTQRSSANNYYKKQYAKKYGINNNKLGLNCILKYLSIAALLHCRLINCTAARIYNFRGVVQA